jgi:structural maintenance of chromosomes protein 5
MDCPLQRLGRSDNLKEFVRKGSTKGQVEVIISGGPSEADYRIERIMWSNDTKSQFRINGVNKTQKDVEALIAKLTIQLDNLCQFLPQEKVVEFSKMSPTDLLLSTERAIGNGRLAEMHGKLISGGGELRKLQDTLCVLMRFKTWIVAHCPAAPSHFPAAPSHLSQQSEFALVRSC